MSEGRIKPNTQLPAELMRYVLAGVLNTGLSYGLYMIMLTWLPYQAAYAVAYTIGIGTQFLMHTYFVYRVPPTAVRLCGYPGIHLLLYGFGALLLHLLVGVSGIDARIAALAVIVASIPAGFLLTRIWLNYCPESKQNTREAVTDDKSSLQD